MRATIYSFVASEHKFKEFSCKIIVIFFSSPIFRREEFWKKTVTLVSGQIVSLKDSVLDECDSVQQSTKWRFPKQRQKAAQKQSGIH